MTTVNIFGASVDTTKSKMQNILLNNYLRKSGDIMTGDIDLGGNKVTNLAPPDQDDDACTLRVVNERFGEAVAHADRLETSLLHKNGDEGAGVLKIGTINNQNVEFIKNDEGFLTFDDTVKLNKDLDIQRHKILNVMDPVEDEDVVTKKYVSTINTELRQYIERLNNTCLHMQGDGGPGIVGIFIGSNTNIPVQLVCNRQRYVLLFQDTITLMHDVDLMNHKIRNIRDPTDTLDGCNKRYVDSKVLTKSYSGYIPVNLGLFRFIMNTTAPVVDNNVLNNIFNDDLNSYWEILNENRPTRFLLHCPEEVIVWKIVMTFQNTNVSRLNIIVYGGDSTNFQNISSNIIRTINNTTYESLQDVNRNKFRGYTIEINPGDIELESLKLVRFQMYVYND